MAVWDKKILWSFVFLLAGAVGQSVNYQDPGCAVKGSTVTLPCTFTPLKSVIDRGQKVLIEIIRVVWCQNHLICQGSTPSVYDSEMINNNNPRYRYLGDKKGNCTLQITDVQKTDEATLRFRMEANNGAAHFTDPPGVKVTVRDGTPMKIESSTDPGNIKKGESVTLNCTVTCTFHQLEVTWFKDGHNLSESGSTLKLNHLTAKDSGNYTCGWKDVGPLSPPYRVYIEAEKEKEKEKEGEPGDKLHLIVVVVSVVLLIVFTLILVFCVIKRRRAAADKGPPAVPPDNIYALQPAEQQQQEASQAAEEVSYASVQFKHKNQTSRAAQESEDSIIYSGVVSRG